MASVRNLSPADVRDLISDAAGPAWSGLLLDVREPWEYAIAHIPGSTLLPMGQLFTDLSTLDPTRDSILVCHHGIRSWHAACLLEQNGFAAVFNLSGGIDAWSREIDPGIPRY